MGLTSRICYLRSVTNLEKKINLPHNESIIIGRSEETGIKDPHVSRKHMELKADVDNSKVFVKTIGLCYSGCNGYAMLGNETYELKSGDIIEPRLGFHHFEIIFEVPETKTANNTNQMEVEKEQNSKETDLFGVKRSKVETVEEKPSKKARIEVLDGINKTDSSLSKKISKNKEDSEAETEKWEEINGKKLLIYTTNNCKPRSMIAAFDLDGTLIKTKSGKRFPQNFDDWVLNFNDLCQKLKKLHDQDYKIIIFTNQSKLSKDVSHANMFKDKIERIAKKLAVPLQVYIATGYTIYRKPSIGMWNTLLEIKNKNIEVNLDKSFYVGDAAGRKKNWAPKKNKDHSICDRLFALNIGLKFYTPEEYFLKSPSASYEMPEFDPRNLTQTSYPNITFPKQEEVVLMVGGPASGKSYYCKTQLVPKGYVYISRDELNTWQKCCRVVEQHIQKKQSVVVDNTNPDKESRQKYVEICKKFDVKCRCFVMETSFKHTMHNNVFRQFTDDTHAPINDMIMHSFKKKYKEPELSEGFTEIIHIPFVPKFDKIEHEKFYKMFLLES